MSGYTSPTLTKVGTVAELTQGQVFRQGHDNLSWIPLAPRPGGGGGGPGNGGGFGS